MKISGDIDLCGPKLIEGWLHCDVADDEPIQLQVYVGDRLIGECTANIFRLDLQEAGYGNGRCGFSFAVPENFAIKQFSETRLRLIDSPVYVLPDEATVVASHLVVERVDS